MSRYQIYLLVLYHSIYLHIFELVLLLRKDLLKNVIDGITVRHFEILDMPLVNVQIGYLAD